MLRYLFVKTHLHPSALGAHRQSLSLHSNNNPGQFSFFHCKVDTLTSHIVLLKRIATDSTQASKLRATVSELDLRFLEPRQFSFARTPRFIHRSSHIPSPLQASTFAATKSPPQNLGHNLTTRLRLPPFPPLLFTIQSNSTPQRPFFHPFLRHLPIITSTT